MKKKKDRRTWLTWISKKNRRERATQKKIGKRVGCWVGKGVDSCVCVGREGEMGK